jgi:hypothetical protein
MSFFFPTKSESRRAKQIMPERQGLVPVGGGRGQGKWVDG